MAKIMGNLRPTQAKRRLRMIFDSDRVTLDEVMKKIDAQIPGIKPGFEYKYFFRIVGVDIEDGGTTISDGISALSIFEREYTVVNNSRSYNGRYRTSDTE
jgi:hypothetical protein